MSSHCNLPVLSGEHKKMVGIIMLEMCDKERPEDIFGNYYVPGMTMAAYAFIINGHSYVDPTDDIIPDGIYRASLSTQGVVTTMKPDNKPVYLYTDRKFPETVPGFLLHKRNSRTRFLFVAYSYEGLFV